MDSPTVVKQIATVNKVGILLTKNGGKWFGENLVVFHTDQLKIFY